MFAVQAGAAKVIGVDNSQIIFNAMAIIRYSMTAVSTLFFYSIKF